MRAVIFGAGNIGRGFLGHLLGQAGYALTFVDVNEQLIEQLNQRGEYPVHLVAADGHTETVIHNVSALSSGDTDAVAAAIERADLLATAVGARALPFVAPVLTKGLVRRLNARAPAINILIAENLADANRVLDDLILRDLPVELVDTYHEHIGLVETTIGRMVPVQTEAMREGDPLRVCAEPYGFFPVDSEAWKGPKAAIPGLVMAKPFSFYVRRKLFIHNMGHALCGYLGLYAGHALVADAIQDSAIQLIVQNAMLESALALHAGYEQPIAPLCTHIDDLLMRFSNWALGDTCQRVGADIERKLDKSDRLIGAMLYAMDQGITPAFIALGAALAAARLLEERGEAADPDSIADVLLAITGLRRGHAAIQLTLSFVPLILRRAAPDELLHAARRLCADAAGQVV